MKKITADWVYPIASEPIENGVVILDDDGKILALDHRDNHDLASLDVRKGTITPSLSIRIAT